MANLKTLEKQLLEDLFKMQDGGFIDFNHKTILEYFRDDMDINIYDYKDYNSISNNSMAGILRRFWLNADNDTVSTSIYKLIGYIEGQIKYGRFNSRFYPQEKMKEAQNIAFRLSKLEKNEKKIKGQDLFIEGILDIKLNKDIASHIQKYLKDGHYYNAVEEAYKIVRKKLKDITGKEKATDAFDKANYEKIFGHHPKDETERDFFEGVKFIHMGIQFLRNEKAHTPARDIDKNLAFHYIALASLAYDLISRNSL